MGTINIKADPLAPYEEIHEVGEDGVITIVPEPLSSRLFLNAPNDVLNGWNKKLTGHSVLDDPNSIDNGDGTFTLEFEADSLDSSLGLDHVENWIAYERADSRIEVYLFNKRIKTLSVTEDNNGYLTFIEVGLSKATKVARAWIRYPDFSKDDNSDGIPNFVDKINAIAYKFGFVTKLEKFIVTEGAFTVTEGYYLVRY